MNISKQSRLWQLLVLAIILAVPIIFATEYERNKLGIVGYDQFTLDKISLFEHKITKTLEHLHAQQKLKQVYTNNVSFTQTERIALQQELADKIESNSWIGAYSNTRKLNIINIVLHTEHEGDRSKIEKNILRALGWFRSVYSMNLTFMNWNSSITFNEIESNIVLVIFQQFRNELVQENIAGRLKKGQFTNLFYINEVVKEIRSTPLFSHCKYTNRNCRQQTVLVMPQHPSFQGCFLNIQNQFFIVDRLDKRTLFQLASNLLDVSEFQQLRSKVDVTEVKIVQFYKLVRNISFLRESQKILKYVRFIMNPIQNSNQKMFELSQRSYQQLYQYVLHGKYISPYIHNVEEKEIIFQLLQLMEKQLKQTADASRLSMDILTDTRVGKIDIFANNFKVGVYLPLFVLFFYPVFIKLKDLLDYILGKIKQRFKRQSKNGIKQE